MIVAVAGVDTGISRQPADGEVACGRRTRVGVEHKVVAVPRATLGKGDIILVPVPVAVAASFGSVQGEAFRLRGNSVVQRSACKQSTLAFDSVLRITLSLTMQ